MPRGRPIDETEEEVQGAALLGEQDIAEAQGWARRHLPSRFTGLTEATPLTDEQVRQRRRENGQAEL